ncbi:MAG: hypothetical protein ACMG55_18055 [Microcoleus sp.]
MAKSVLLSAVVYPVYQTTALRVEKLLPGDRGRWMRRKILHLTDKFCAKPALLVILV